jgi:hypothetical protein
MEARAPQPHKSDTHPADQPDRQSFQHAYTSIGAAGHWIRTAGILAPLIIGEFVKDAEKRWRWTRISAVATALISEGFYTQRIQQERKERSQRDR